MDVIKTAVDKISKGQTPMIVFDQPLHALTKKVQWNWKDIYGETQFVVMMRPLHTEMAALKTLGDWLKQRNLSYMLHTYQGLGVPIRYEL